MASTEARRTLRSARPRQHQCSLEFGGGCRPRWPRSSPALRHVAGQRLRMPRRSRPARSRNRAYRQPSSPHRSPSPDGHPHRAGQALRLRNEAPSLRSADFLGCAGSHATTASLHPEGAEAASVAIRSTPRQRAITRLVRQLIGMEQPKSWTREIGKYISRKIEKAEWGEGVVARLVQHLARRFPGRRGSTRANLSNAPVSRDLRQRQESRTTGATIAVDAQSHHPLAVQACRTYKNAKERRTRRAWRTTRPWEK